MYVAAFLLAVLADIPEFPRTKVDAAMRATIASRRVNGLTLAVVRNGSIVYARAYGMRDAGVKWRHSNTNYLLLRMLIEKISGKPYERVIFDDVLARAPGANFSVIDDEARLSQMARGYVGDSLSPPLSGSWPRAAGNLVGSVGDLVAWDAALSSAPVVSKASYATMTSQQTPASSATVAGFPFFIDTHRGYARLWHDGATIGFSVADDYYPQLKIRVIVFANANNGGIADELATVTVDDWIPGLRFSSDRLAPPVMT